MKAGTAALVAARTMMDAERVTGHCATAGQRMPVAALVAGPTLAENRPQGQRLDSRRGRFSQATSHPLRESQDDRSARASGRPRGETGFDFEAAMRGRAARVLTCEEFAARARGLMLRPAMAGTTSEFGFGRILRGAASAASMQSERID